MALPLLLPIFLLWSLLLSTPTTALDITKVLDQYPEYSQFSEILTKTGVAEEINKQKSITVFAVPNGAMSGVEGKDDGSLEVLMRVHAVPDYYDSAKIKELKDDAELRTMYPATGTAGLLKVKKEDNDIKLISGASGSSVSVRVTKVVTSIPSDLSVVEVSNTFISPGPDGNSPISPSPSSSSDSPPPPSPPEDNKSPPPSPSDSDDGKDSDDSKDGANGDDEEDDDKAPDAVASNSPRNALVSGFVLMASLFALLSVKYYEFSPKVTPPPSSAEVRPSSPAKSDHLLRRSPVIGGYNDGWRWWCGGGTTMVVTVMMAVLVMVTVCNGGYGDSSILIQLYPNLPIILYIYFKSTMALSLLLSIFLLWSPLLSTPTTALDITKILDQHPNYALFNQLLTKTHVAEEINKRESVTVLAVPNAAMSSVATQDEETLRIVMKIHAVLDYYDSAKIKKVEDGTTLTTLYQTTGSADKDAGFLKVTKEKNEIKLISGASGSSVSARVTKVVTSIPSDLSIVEVSNAIVPPGLEGSTISSTDSSLDSDSDSSPAPSPRKHHKHHKAPAPSPSDSDDEKDSDSPAPSPDKHGHDHKNTHKNAPAPCDDSDGASDDADPDDADANDADDDEEDDDMGTDEVPSSSPRNAIASGFALLASLFAIML
ncbi:hypothetical protein OSB04_012695 [Centaurea solstitialis]|uniref:FAS1 domain-containing protein n=1 Tax=Centaurea solstitialis TaxID=347529 RepID=A0AA38WQT6_9ASTR|nr:hypothetical protein OSB04_012695 [Centaurea solstitialis]